MTFATTPPPTERSSVHDDPIAKLRQQIRQDVLAEVMASPQVVSMRVPPAPRSALQAAKDHPRWFATLSLVVPALTALGVAWLTTRAAPAQDAAAKAKEAQEAAQASAASAATVAASAASGIVDAYQRGTVGPWRDEVGKRLQELETRDNVRDPQLCQLGAQLYWVAGCPVGRVERERKRR